MVFEILNTLPKEGYRWTIGEDTARELEKAHDVLLINNKPTRKIYQEDEQSESFFPLWGNFSDSCGTSESGKSLLYNILEKEHGFETVKPIDLIKKLLFHFSNSNDIILDFFSGSSTTAHAVMQLNAEDGGNRKFIMVQLAEPCDEKSEAFKAGYKTIAEIGKERIRRAGKKIVEELKAEQAKKSEKSGKEKAGLFAGADNKENQSETEKAGDLDIGFRVFKVDSSNMRDVYYSPDSLSKRNLFSDNIKPDRTSLDLLFQVMLDWGIELSAPIDCRIVCGKEVFFVGVDSLAACFDSDITDEATKQIAKTKPLRAVFSDNSFKTDSAKINVEQIFKMLSPNTEIKTI
jgi:adenine-specific DNA-methyltransferase